MTVKRRVHLNISMDADEALVLMSLCNSYKWMEPRYGPLIQALFDALKNELPEELQVLYSCFTTGGLLEISKNYNPQDFPAVYEAEASEGV